MESLLFITCDSDLQLKTYRQSYRRGKNFNKTFDPVKEWEKIHKELDLPIDEHLCILVDVGKNGGVIEYEELNVDNHNVDEWDIPRSRFVKVPSIVGDLSI